MNILQKIIKDMLKEFKEPKREGTPKGDVIGFQQDKFAAALWCLTSLSKQEIAKLAGCNYNSLLSWRSRDDFKAAVMENAESAARVIVNSVYETNSTLFEQIYSETQNPDAYFLMLMKPVDEKTTTKNYGKISYYAPFMINTVFNTLIHKMKEFESLDLSNVDEMKKVVVMLYTAQNLLAWVYPYIEKKRDMKEVEITFATVSQTLNSFLTQYVMARVFPVLDEHAPYACFLLQNFLNYHGIIELAETPPE